MHAVDKLEVLVELDCYEFGWYNDLEEMSDKPCDSQVTVSNIEHQKMSIQDLDCDATFLLIFHNLSFVELIINVTVYKIMNIFL